MTLLQIYQSLPKPIRPASKALYLFAKKCRNIVTLPFLKYRKDLFLHLGCGEERKEGFVNIDVRTTPATDYSADLNDIRWTRPGTARLVYSNAFFEHLYKNNRTVHLKAVYSILQEDGACCYIGLPYFPNIAKYYLEGRKPGIVGDQFDLFNVYRFTHGDPEHAPTWWQAQLHKSLFDEKETAEILHQAGFSSYVMFTFCYVREEGWHVQMGFYTRKGAHGADKLKAEATEFLSRNCRNKVLVDTLIFLPQ